MGCGRGLGKTKPIFGGRNQGPGVGGQQEWLWRRWERLYKQSQFPADGQERARADKGRTGTGPEPSVQNKANSREPGTPNEDCPTPGAVVCWRRAVRCGGRLVGVKTENDLGRQVS
jgi:hypothetical protein